MVCYRLYMVMDGYGYRCVIDGYISVYIIGVL